MRGPLKWFSPAPSSLPHTPGEIMRRAEVRWRLFIAVSLVPATFAGFLWLLRYLLVGPSYDFVWPINYLLSPARYAGTIVSLLLLSALLFLYLYLQTGLAGKDI
jgi:hypothetical protein